MKEAIQLKRQAILDTLRSLPQGKIIVGEVAEKHATSPAYVRDVAWTYGISLKRAVEKPPDQTYDDMHDERDGWHTTASRTPPEGVPLETAVPWCKDTHVLTYAQGRWWAVPGVAYVSHVPTWWRRKR